MSGRVICAILPPRYDRALIGRYDKGFRHIPLYQYPTILQSYFFCACTGISVPSCYIRRILIKLIVTPFYSLIGACVERSTHFVYPRSGGERVPPCHPSSTRGRISRGQKQPRRSIHTSYSHSLNRFTVRTQSITNLNLILLSSLPETI